MYLKCTFIVHFGSYLCSRKRAEKKGFSSLLADGRGKKNSPVTDQRVNGAEPTVYGFLFVLQNKK